MWSKWSRSKWSFSFSECVICSLYINIKYLYIVEDFDNSKSFWPNDQMTKWPLDGLYPNPMWFPRKSYVSPIFLPFLGTDLQRIWNGLTTDLKRTWNGGIADTYRGKVFCSFVVVLLGVMDIMIISRHISVFWLLQSNSDFFWGIMCFFVV